MNVFGGDEKGVDLGEAEGLGKNVGGSDSGRGAGRFDSSYRKKEQSASRLWGAFVTMDIP